MKLCEDVNLYVFDGRKESSDLYEPVGVGEFDVGLVRTRRATVACRDSSKPSHASASATSLNSASLMASPVFVGTSGKASGIGGLWIGR